MSKSKKIVLSPEQELWMKKHFKHTKNDDIASRFGISVKTVGRLARELGLKKSWQFMRKLRIDAAMKANESHRRNGTYPPKGYVIPNREKTYFKKGERPIDRIGAKREEQRIRNNVASVARTRRLERARALFGLPRQTKLNVIKHPKKQTALRYYLKKNCGYIVERGGFIFYYTDLTKRNLEIESRPRTGFTFLPLTQ